MRDPLDEENPFLGEYDEWDLWCYRNARDRKDEDTSAYLKDGWPDDWEYVMVDVDSSGWLRPLLSTYSVNFDRQLGYYGTAAGEGCAGSIICLGPMDAELKMELARRLSAIKAPYYLPVPEWLAKAPPVVAMHLPDGRFALLGEPGSGSGSEHMKLRIDDPADEDLAWAVYSAAGELEFAGQPGEHWWQLFAPDLKELTGYSIKDLTCHDFRGLLIFRNREDRDRAATLTWDGRELHDDWNENEVDPRTLAMLSGPEIPLIYASQQGVELRQPYGWGIGLSSKATFDLAKPFATGYSGFGRGDVYIQVKPLDDPGNPYSEYYTDCDRTDFREHELICSEFSFNQLMTHDDFEPMDMRDIMLAGEYGDEEYTFIETSISVDDDGYVIPLLLDSERYLTSDSNRVEPILDYINEHTKVNFTITTARFINPEIDDVFRRNQHCMQARYLPVIPAWLAEQPPVEAVLLPDGEVAALGKPGSAAADADETSLPWYRYSASGELLAESEPGAEWWEAFFPQFREVYAGLGGEEVVSYWQDYGYISFYYTDSDDYMPPEVYSYKGEKAERAPYSGNSLPYMPVPGKYLSAMRAEQQAAE